MNSGKLNSDHIQYKVISAIALVAINFPKKESESLFSENTSVAAQMHFMHDRFNAELAR